MQSARRVIAALVLGLVALAAAGAGGATGAGPPGGGGLCPVLDLVPPLACRSQEPAPAGQSAASSAQAEAEEPDQVRQTSTTVRHDPRRIAVTFKRGVTPKKIQAAFARAEVTLEQAIPAIRAYMVGVDPSRLDTALESLRSSSDVASAGQEVLADALDASPNDVDWPQQWGLRVTGFPQAWKLASGAKPIVVGVIDTGVDPTQTDLRGVVVPGYDFVHQTTNPLDDEGHGTAVAGMIAARTNNYEGIAGVCGSCQIMPVKVLDETGVGDDSVIAAGIVWAVDHGARVINLSLGGPGTTRALDDAVAYAVRKGALVAAAAGNSSSTTPFYPAASPQAVSVAATTEADRPYSWSNYGSWVKLAAPGCNPAPLLAGGYGMFCGTSSATPIVAGLAALVLGVTDAGPQQLEQALEKVAVPLSGFVRYGRIDAAGSLSAPASAAPPAQAPAETTVVIRGTLTVRSRERSSMRPIQAGRVTATLRFKGARSLSLALIPQSPGGEIIRASGPSPIRLERVLPAGTVRFLVRSELTPTTTFTLTITNQPGATTPPATGAGIDSVVVSQARGLEKPVLVAVNRIRRAHGLRPLKASPRLVRAARGHLRALAVAGQFRHEWPDGRRFDLWIRRFYPVAGANVWVVGENLIWRAADLTPEAVTDAWLASPPHRRVLLAPYWRELGIGVVRADGAGGAYGGADVMITAAEFGARS